MSSGRGGSGGKSAAVRVRGGGEGVDARGVDVVAMSGGVRVKGGTLPGGERGGRAVKTREARSEAGAGAVER